MRRIVGILAIMCLALVLSACSGGETKVFEMEEDGVVIKMTFKYEDDQVIEQTTENIVPYAAIDVASKEEAKRMFADATHQFQNVDGITHKMDYKNDKIIEHLRIQYEKIDFDEVQDLPGMMFDGDLEQGVSMKETEEMLKDLGFEEK